jgi:hypothetical protein
MKAGLDRFFISHSTTLRGVKKMNEFDVIIGMDAATLNQAIGRLYRRDDLRATLFRGSRTQSIEDTVFTVQWDLQAAPETVLESPADRDWRMSITADGGTAHPVANAFYLKFPRVRLVQSAPETHETTISARAICAAGTNGNQLNIQVIALLIDLSGASKTDQFFYKRMIIPEILNLATALLSGLTLPTLAFANIALTPPLIAIQSNRLLAFANLAERPLSARSDGNWPNQPWFILCSPRLVQRIGDFAAGTVRGKTFNHPGHQNFEIGVASYRAAGIINEACTTVTADLTVMDCRLRADAKVSADLVLHPLDPVKKVVKKFIDLFR